LHHFSREPKPNIAVVRTLVSIKVAHGGDNASPGDATAKIYAFIQRALIVPGIISTRAKAGFEYESTTYSYE